MDFTLSNARRFYSSMGKPLDGKGLMTGPEGNNFNPENLNVSRDQLEGNIEVRGKQNPLLPSGPVTKRIAMLQKKWIKPTLSINDKNKSKFCKTR